MRPDNHLTGANHMADDNSLERTDTYVFVSVHEDELSSERSTLMQLGRVPLVGEEIYFPADHCLRVTRVIHLGANGSSIDQFPRSAHAREYPRVGSVCALVVCVSEAFDPDLIPDDHR